MAIAFIRAQIIGRKAGRSAVAAAAYRAGVCLFDQRQDKEQDYLGKGGILAEGVMTPKDAPEWMRDREQLWNAIEHREDRSTRPDEAQLAREMVIALPHELDDEKRLFLVKNIGKCATALGMIMDYGIHAPDEKGDDRNYHAHIMLTMRGIDADDPHGFGGKNRAWNSKTFMDDFKQTVEKETNKMLERAGIEERITFEFNHGERESFKHLGVAVTALERQGIETDAGDENRAIAERNAQRQAERVQRQSIGADLIGYAWHEAERDPVQFAVELGDNGLSLATDKKGQFVAVDGAGYVHYLTAAALGDDRPKDVQELLGQTFNGGGLTVPTVDEVRQIIKAEELEAWKAERKAERRAAYIEKQRERHKDDETARAINYDYGASDTGASYAAALREDKILFCRVSDDEAERMALAQEYAKASNAEHIPAAYEAGAFLAVAHSGRTYRIDATTIHDSDEAIKQRFADYDPGMTWTEAKDAQREARRIERQESRYDTLTENERTAPTLAAIGEAYAASVSGGDFGAAFVEELEKRDLLYVVVSEEEALRSKAQHEAQASFGRYAPEYEAGQALVIDKSGRAYTLDRSTIYDDPASIAANLATVNAAEQLSLTQGREVMAFWRDQEREEPRSFAHDSEDAAPGLAILGNSAGRALGLVLRSLGDVLDYFAGSMPTRGHAAPSNEAAPEPGPTIQEQRRETLRNSAETIGQDPNAQSLAQSMNADEDIRQRAEEIARQQRDRWYEEDRERDR